mmetsp:Transcript_11231/g.45297  ORF Transcript_11231/g.45297 Transcript_11231/m.45297 type:complete len:202 (-) Transcript_11231:1235-1840(-)
MDGGGDARADAVLRRDGGARNGRAPAVVHARGALHRDAKARARGHLHRRHRVSGDAGKGDDALQRRRRARLEGRARDSIRRAGNQPPAVGGVRRQGAAASLLFATARQDQRRRVGPFRPHQGTARGGRGGIGADAHRQAPEALHQGQQRRREERRRQEDPRRGLPNRASRRKARRRKARRSRRHGRQPEGAERVRDVAQDR